MSKFLAGLILGLIVVPLGVYLYFSTGSAPVATAAQAMPFEKMLARKALHVRVEKEMPKDVPLQPDEANLAAGAQLYVQNCAFVTDFQDNPRQPSRTECIRRPRPCSKERE